MERSIPPLFFLLCLLSNHIRAQSYEAITQVFPTVDSTAEGSYFGVNVAIDGDYAAISNSREKVAYVLHYQRAERRWKRIAKLSYPDSMPWYGLREAVAIEGNIIAVSGPDMVYVYEKSAEGWVDTNQAVQLTRHSEEINPQWQIFLQFGTSISISNGNILVGSNYDAAYVYVKPQGGWYDMTQTATLAIEGSRLRYPAGEKVYFLDTVALVSDEWRDDATGGIHVFRRPAGGWKNAKSSEPLRPADSQPNDRFGTSLKVMPDGRLAVGAPGAEIFGAAYLWRDYTKGGHTQVTKITQPNRDRDFNNGNFGYHIDAKGHTIAVTDINNDTYIYETIEDQNIALTTPIENPLSYSYDNRAYPSTQVVALHETGTTLLVGNSYHGEGGVVYAYSQPPAGWPISPDYTQTFYPPRKLTAYLDEFGSAVAVDGNYAVVGSNNDDENGKDNGAIYVFRHEAGEWHKKAKLNFGSDHQIQSHIAAVAISGNTVVVKLHNGDLPLYVYQRPEEGWVDMPPTAQLSADDSVVYNLTGSALAIDSNTVVSTAYREKASAVFVFQKPEGGWRDTVPIARLSNSIGEASSFGTTVAIDGNTIAVGDSGYDNDKGAILIYERSGQNWTDMTESAILRTSVGISRDRLGARLSMAGNTIVASVQQKKQGSKALYLFEKTTDQWVSSVETARLSYENDNFFSETKPLSITDNFVVAPEHKETFVFQKPAWGWSNAMGKALNFDHLVIEQAMSGDRLLIGNSVDNTKGSSAGTAYFYKLCESRVES